MTEKNDLLLGSEVTPITQAGVFELLEKSTKGAVVLLAVAYALGLLVTNQALIGLGVSDYSSVRPKFVLTGLWSLMLIVSAALPMVLPLRSLINFEPKTERTKEPVNGLTILLCVLAGNIVIFGLLGFHWPDAGILSLVEVGLFFIVVWLGLVTLYYAVLALRLGFKINRVLIIETLLMLFFFMSIVFATRIIADMVYPHIPEASGGGAPVFGSLILHKDGGEEFWKEAGIGQNDKITTNPRSRLVRLLYQDEHIMIVQVFGNPNLKRMTLNKSLVDAFVLDVTFDSSILHQRLKEPEHLAPAVQR